MEEKIYVLGLFGNPKLIVKDNDVFHYLIKGNNSNILLDCKISERLMKMDRNDERDCSGIEKDVKKMLNEDGTRWEGDWYNEQPFGFGSVYDGEGNRIYSGFMFDGKKIGFGTEYFADNHKVDYCGNFMNDKRHGWNSVYVDED